MPMVWRNLSNQGLVLDLVRLFFIIVVWVINKAIAWVAPTASAAKDRSLSRKTRTVPSSTVVRENELRAGRQPRSWLSSSSISDFGWECTTDCHRSTNSIGYDRSHN